MNVGKLLGVWDFGLAGHVAAAYSLVLLFLLARSIVNTSLGWTRRGAQP